MNILVITNFKVLEIKNDFLVKKIEQKAFALVVPEKQLLNKKPDADSIKKTLKMRPSDFGISSMEDYNESPCFKNMNDRRLSNR